MSSNDWSLEAWMVQESRTWLERFEESLDPVKLRYHKLANNAMKKVRPLLDDPRPLDLVRNLHSKVFEDVKALRTPAQLETFEVVLLSELLCAFPLRAKHWPEMLVTQGPIPDNPPTESLHIYDDVPGPNLSRYAIVVPTSRLKNEHTSREVHELDPPRYVYDLPDFLDGPISRYLQEVRPRLIEPQSQHLFSTTSVATLRNRLQKVQERYFIGPLGLSKAWGFHPYRVLVATHAVKNALERPFEVAASLLLDSTEMVRSTYGHYRAEDSHDTARASIAPTEPKGGAS